MKTLILLLLAFATQMTARAEAETKTVVKPYPFDFCIVQQDEKLDPEAEPYAAVHDGQQYRFCCRDCLLKRLAKDTAVQRDDAHEKHHLEE